MFASSVPTPAPKPTPAAVTRAYCDGLNLVDLASGKDGSSRDYLVLEINHDRAVVTSRYKYIFNSQGTGLSNKVSQKERNKLVE